VLTLCVVLLSAGLLPDYLLIAWDLGCCYAEYCLLCPLLVSVIFLAFSSIYLLVEQPPPLWTDTGTDFGVGLFLVLFAGNWIA
jgi:hypothetical protein